MRVLPIIFNTEMVRAILDGRKTVTRRVIKPQPDWFDCGIFGDRNTPMKAVNIEECEIKSPYYPGDILYVRETWCDIWDSDGWWCDYGYKVDGEPDIGHWGTYKGGAPFRSFSWHPSIHMPKIAARIWLKVMDVRVERLQDITEDGAQAEGAQKYQLLDGSDYVIPAVKDFEGAWNSTTKKTDLAMYGWDANPWVWVIEFERCEKPMEDTR